MTTRVFQIKIRARGTHLLMSGNGFRLNDTRLPEAQAELGNEERAADGLQKNLDGLHRPALNRDHEAESGLLAFWSLRSLRTVWLVAITLSSFSSRTASVSTGATTAEHFFEFVGG